MTSHSRTCNPITLMLHVLPSAATCDHGTGDWSEINIATSSLIRELSVPTRLPCCCIACHVFCANRICLVHSFVRPSLCHALGLDTSFRLKLPFTRSRYPDSFRLKPATRFDSILRSMFVVPATHSSPALTAMIVLSVDLDTFCTPTHGL